MTYDTERIKVLWKKGQNFFAAFFAEVSNVRKAINNDAIFIRWCAEDLGLPLMTITRISDVLTLADAARVKAELASARAVEQEQRRKEREYRDLVAAQERKRREEEKILAAAEKIRQEQQKKAAAKEERRKASKLKNNAGWRKLERERKDKALAALGNTMNHNIVEFKPRTPLSEKTEDEIVAAIKNGLAKSADLRSEWAANWCDVAENLLEGRNRYPADQRYSQWLAKHKIEINPNDRAALLNLGVNKGAMYTILMQAESTSLQLIWRETQKQLAANGCYITME